MELAQVRGYSMGCVGGLLLLLAEALEHSASNAAKEVGYSIPAQEAMPTLVAQRTST